MKGRPETRSASGGAVFVDICPRTGELGAVDQHVATVRLDQMQYQARQGGLAAATFTDEAERLAALQGETHVGDGPHRTTEHAQLHGRENFC